MKQHVAGTMAEDVMSSLSSGEKLGWAAFFLVGVSIFLAVVARSS